MKHFELKHLVFRRSARFTLEIGDFQLDHGEKVAVVGPNGSGKTTLLRLLSFLEKPGSWTEFLFKGHPYSTGKIDRQGLGFLKQEPYLFSGSVADNLAYPLKLKRLPATDVAQRVDAMLTRMELDHLAAAQARQLSGGEQKRLALGRVLIAENDTLLLDEPVAHLDARSRSVIEHTLKEAESTILLTTHDQPFAHRVADRVLNLSQGRFSHPAPGAIFRGQITSIRADGGDVCLEVENDERLTVVISREIYEEKCLNLHQGVVVRIDDNAVEVVSAGCDGITGSSIESR